MNIGHDGAGAMDDFGPESAWAYWHNNPEDDEAFAQLQKMFDEAEPVEPDPADWWKGESEYRGCE